MRGLLFGLTMFAATVHATPPEDAARAELTQRFEQATLMLHAHEYEYAVTALHRVLALAPRLPEAHVNMGYALVGLKRWAAARDFFNAAIALRAGQVNAYYGLAMAHEGLCDLAAARGAMRTYIHLARADDPYLARARAALWEWDMEPRGPATEACAVGAQGKP